MAITGAAGTSNTITNSGTILSLANAFGIRVANNAATAGSVTVTNSGNIHSRIPRNFGGLGAERHCGA